MKLLMKTLSSLEKVFLDEEPMRVSTAHSALRNESSAFQIAYTVIPEEGDEAKYAGSVALEMEIESPIKEFIRVRRIDHVPIRTSRLSRPSKERTANKISPSRTMAELRTRTPSAVPDSGDCASSKSASSFCLR